MSEHYKHTQIGWVIVGSLAVAALLLVPLLVTIGSTGAAVTLAVLLVALLLFATLTVSADDEFLRFQFGIGLIGKRIAFGDLRTYREVENPWYYGWGIRLYPGGVLYNVSGFSAVELVLKNGKHLRIGTDEPGELLRAIAKVAGEPVEPSPGEVERERRSARRWVVVFAIVLTLIASSIGGCFYLQMKPPRVEVGTASLRVESLFYSEEIALKDVTDLELADVLPRIEARTNGFALGGTLRGHFRLRGLGNGQLFVERGTPPYVLVRTSSSYVFFNFHDPARTRTLFADLKRARAAE